MPDYFQLLSAPRRPWLDADVLKQQFLALSSQVHPDKIHSAPDAEKIAAARAFAELNAAHRCLSEPKSRLLHLLELELGAKPADIQQIPAGLADLFAEVATVCCQTDLFLLEKARATSPLVQVELFGQCQAWLEKLDALQHRLDDCSQRLPGELQSLDARWVAADAAGRPAVLAALEDLYRLFGYFNRWNRQLTERKMLLMS